MLILVESEISRREIWRISRCFLSSSPSDDVRECPLRGERESRTLFTRSRATQPRFASQGRASSTVDLRYPGEIAERESAALEDRRARPRAAPILRIRFVLAAREIRSRSAGPSAWSA